MSGAPRIMAHMVAWYPDCDRSLEVARGLLEGGCSYLEVQFPFSDPSADGPDIQRACAEALRSGFTVSEGFRLIDRLRGSAAPVFVMSYASLLFARGVDRFIGECAACGVRGVIVPDLPVDQDEGLFETAARRGLAAVPVLSPSMREERLRRVLEPAHDYVYATLRTGITGSQTCLDEGSRSFLGRIGGLAPRSRILGGFGISQREQVAALAPLVHAVVVGSALVRAVTGSADPRKAARDRLRELMT